MRGGDSYYVLVNNQDEIYETEDFIGYSEALICSSWEEAEDCLATLIADEALDENDGWHVERHRW